MTARPTRVLLVEDDADTREMYATYLSFCGLDVEPEANARLALESIRLTLPDVVVTDIAMPGMDGLELSRRLRADGPTRDVPIIAVTGQWAPPAHDAGCDLVLAKPCLPDELLEAIRLLVTAHRQALDAVPHVQERPA